MTTVGLPATLTYSTVRLVRAWSGGPPVPPDQKVGVRIPSGARMLRGAFRSCGGASIGVFDDSLTIWRVLPAPEDQLSDGQVVAR